MFQINNKLFWFLSVVFGLFMVISFGSAQASTLIEAPCVKLFKNKQILRAARCFERVMMKLPSKKKYYRGRMLRNAAVLWKRAATKTKNEENSNRYNRRALKLFNKYISNKMCLEMSSCEDAKKERDALQAKLKIPPRRRVVPRRVVKRRIVRRPPPPPIKKKGVSPLAWVGYIGGGVLAVTGGVLLGMGHAANHTAQKQAKSNMSKDITSSKTLSTTGVILLGAGGALLVTGVIAGAM